MTFEEIVEEMRLTNKMMWSGFGGSEINWLACTPQEALDYARFEIRRTRAIRMYKQAINDEANKEQS